MIDNVKITLENFTGNFDNCRYWKENDHYICYRLSNTTWNDACVGKHSLEIAKSKKRNKVVISRSLRKWRFGADSFADLSPTSLERVIRELADGLNITTQELCRGKVTQCEIGLTFKVNMPCSKFINTFVGYSTLERKVVSNSKTPNCKSVYFIGSDKKLIIYDKLKERACKTINKSRQKAFEKLLLTKNHFLRIEFKLFDKKSFQSHDMPHIQTLGDLHVHFSNLYKFWCREVKRLIIFKKIDTNDNEMTPTDYAYATALNADGYTKFTKSIYSKCKTKKSRSDCKKRIHNLIKTKGKSSYPKKKLKLDILNHLIRKKRNSNEILDIPLLSQLLFGENPK